ncbi:hypothetical protein SIAM614_00357 [Stappia aggregata IAM 12614]|uniref:Uncharacterized protein n=1 Tax=Roseibium aggregatum (strain ATCC 25650 / DSM 13394 / JCM 20685 / NBRC 16684 / NCIMB 2208 / IAM 12614 / B1) TaxID=384765 RepID=A0P2J4_ROSAI|nr:hypothetical protein SIAM614_00357 [Stappia aggregata IAM 12614] [Roseibium aggregatum IAM 12614]
MMAVIARAEGGVDRLAGGKCVGSGLDRKTDYRRDGAQDIRFRTPGLFDEMLRDKQGQKKGVHTGPVKTREPRCKSASRFRAR